MALKIPLRTAVGVYLVVIHLLFAVVAFSPLRERPLLIVMIELAFVGSLWIGYRLIRALTVPLDLVRTGSDMIEEGEFTSHFRKVGQPEVDRLVGVYNSMIDRLREERLRVREQNEFLDRLVEASPAGIVVCDFDGKVSQLNPAAEGILGTGQTSVIGESPAKLPVLAPLSQLEIGRSEVLPLPGGRRLKGTRTEFRDRGFPRVFFLLEELTEELRRSEKQAYGQLIRTISHEVNNTVGPVASLVDSVGSYGADLGAEDRRRFEVSLEVASQRLDHLRSFVEGFADVVRLPPPSLAPCDLGVVIDEVLLLIAPLLEERGIEWSWESREDLGRVAVDKNQFEQVLINVLKNAAEATPKNGRIHLRSSRQGSRRRLEIEDSGAGLSAEAMEAVFRPFYTTKENGRGLGLTLVNEILTNHGFAFSLENGKESGAVFRIFVEGSPTTA